MNRTTKPDSTDRRSGLHGERSDCCSRILTPEYVLNGNVSEKLLSGSTSVAAAIVLLG